MKKVFRILIAAVIMLSCALSLVACSDPSTSAKEPGLHLGKNKNGVYTINKYVAEEGVSILDIDAEIADDVEKIKIKKGAFSGNTSLTKIIVPSRVVEIEEGAFAGIKNLESLVLPFVGKTANSDADIKESQTAADKSVDRARTIAHLFGTEEYDAGVPIVINYNEKSSETVYMPATFSSVTIKADSDYTIPMFAFNGAVNLLSVELVGEIDGIGRSAFVGCKELREISLPISVSKIYKNAFSGCSKLSTLTLASGAVLTVGEGAFVGTKIDRAVFDGVVADIDEEMKNEIFGEVE